MSRSALATRWGRRLALSNYHCRRRSRLPPEIPRTWRQPPGRLRQRLCESHRRALKTTFPQCTHHSRMECSHDREGGNKVLLDACRRLHLPMWPRPPSSLGGCRLESKFQLPCLSKSHFAASPYLAHLLSLVLYLKVAASPNLSHLLTLVSDFWSAASPYLAHLLTFVS